MLTIKNFTQTNVPVALIYGINNPLAISLLNLFLEEGTKTIVVDRATSKIKSIVSPYAKNHMFMFVDSRKFSDTYTDISHLDYVFAFWNHIIVGSSYPQIYKNKIKYIELIHKDYINQTQIADLLIKLGIEFATKLSFILPGYLGQLMYENADYNIELHKHLQTLFKDYYNKTPFHGKLLFIPEPIGSHADIAAPTVTNYVFRQVVRNNIVKVPGQGLIPINSADSDALKRAILLATFSTKAKGKSVLLFDKDTTTLLKLLYTALEITQNDISIEFIDTPPALEKNITIKDSLSPVDAINYRDLGVSTLPLSANSVYEHLTKLNKALSGNWSPTSPKEAHHDATSNDLQIHGEPSSPPDIPSYGHKYKDTTNILQRIFWKGIFNFYDKLIQKPIEFITSLLSGKTTIKDLKNIFVIITYVMSLVTLALLLTPWAGIGITLIKLKGTTHKLSYLPELQKYTEQLSYLKYTPLKDTYLNLRGHLETLNTLASIMRQTDTQLYDVLNFLNNPTRTPNLLQDIATNPHTITLLRSKLETYLSYFKAQQEYNYPPYLNTLQTLTTQIEQEAMDKLSLLSSLEIIYPYLPKLFGYQRKVYHTVVFVDAATPTPLMGAPLGALIFSANNGDIKIENFIPLTFEPILTQNLASMLAPRQYTKLLNQTIQRETGITPDYIYIIEYQSAFTILPSVNIPEYGALTSSKAKDFVAQITTIQNLPYDLSPFATEFLRSFLKIPYDEKTMFLKNLVRHAQILVIHTPSDVSPLFTKYKLLPQLTKSSLNILPITYSPTPVDGLTKKLFVTPIVQEKKINLKIIYENTAKTDKTLQERIYTTGIHHITYSSNLKATVNTTTGTQYVDYKITIAPNSKVEAFLQLYIEDLTLLENLRVYPIYPFVSISYQ